MFVVISLSLSLSLSLSQGIIDIGAIWTSDLKVGVCPASSYYDKDHCCWLSNDTYFGTENCHAWHNWATHHNIDHSTAAQYAFNYFVYVALSVLFAGLAGLFVIVLAPYAAGSGIPEVIYTCIRYYKYIVKFSYYKYLSI